jgi:hypothetical protein
MFSGRMFAPRMFPPVISGIIHVITDIITVTLSDVLRYVTNVSTKLISGIMGNELEKNSLVTAEALTSSTQSNESYLWNTQTQEHRMEQIDTFDNETNRIQNLEQVAGHTEILDSQNQSISNNEVEQ